jgi:hypothetical protein
MTTHTRRALPLLTALLLLTAACDDTGTEGAQTGVECARSDLIAQCPPGSDPRLDASSSSQCEASGEADLIMQDGKVTGSCVGEGSCQVLCQFLVPCACGVDRITDEGVFCTDCASGAACGNGACEATESADSCPADCGPVCQPDAARCNGDAREVCNLAGRWDSLACPDGETCRPDQSDTPTCQPR